MKTIWLFLFITLVAQQSKAQDAWTLQRCIDHAFQYNLNIRQGGLNIQLSEADKKNTIGNMFPSLNANAGNGYNWGQAIDPFTNQFASSRIQTSTFGISTGLNIFSGFQMQNTLKQNKVDIESDIQNLEQIKNNIALSVSGAFLNVLQNQELLSIAKFNFDNTTTQANRIQKLVDAGQLAQGNLSDILAQQATDNASFITAQNNLYLAELNLMQMIQLTPEEMATFRISSPDEDPESLQLLTDANTAVSNALSNFPEIKKAEYNLQSAEYGEKIAKGGYYPNLGMSFSYGSGYSGASERAVGDPEPGDPYLIGYVGDTFDPVYTIPFDYSYEKKPFTDQVSDNLNRQFYVNLQIPIFNGFNTNTNVQRARINRETAAINLEQTKQTLTQDVQKAFADAQAAKTNYEASKLALDASEKAFGYAQSRYEQGVINNADYTDARTRVDTARTNLTRNKYEYLFRAKILEFYQGKAITFR